MHLAQYTVLEIQSWSVKYTAVTAGYAKISSKMHSFPFKRQATIMVRPEENKPLQNTFKRI